ncbi:alpha/beta hydrolase [bacterium]|nr:MAG: alpha/beta hydrolase [bacterium]
MAARRLILFCGMGADGRLMRPLRLPGIQVLTPDHIEPTKGEPLAAYAARVADRHGIGSTDVVGGASFGGMLAAEIAKQRPVAGLVLLGTCVRPYRLQWSYKLLYALRHLIPDFALRLRGWEPLVRWRFEPATPEALALLTSMNAACPASHIREFGRMAVEWEGAAEQECPTLSVHGRLDRVIPLKCGEPGVVLEDAGHAFTLTHAEQTSAAVGAFLRAAI